MIDWKMEIERTYRALSPWEASIQNERDIDNWVSDGYISKDEAKELRHYSRELEKAINI